MAGRRAKRNSAEGGGGVGSGGAGGPSEPATDEPPPTTDSGRQRIVNELENSKNRKADAVSMIGQEIETKKHNYIITREIMKGRMSRVFEVRRNKDSKILAMKAHLPDDAGKAILLRHEAHIYHELSVVSKKMQKDEIRFLTIYDYGECSEGEFLFLTLGGESLANFLSEEKAPNFQTALDLSFQMLNVIEQIHTLGFIHSRIRPNTFITGTKSRERYTLFIINFSLARMANPTRAEPTVSRTPPQIFDRYAPRCQHFGQPYHRRDDLESWFYICCDLFHPLFLPWPSEKRLKSAQMAELKDKLMKGELYYRFTVMPKPFQAFAGAINETDAKMPNYNFFKECLMEEAKTKNCSFYAPWDFIPTASLPAVPESLSQTRIEFEFNQCVKSPTTFNFGTEKSRTILPEDSKEAPSSQTSDVQILLPKPKSKSPASPSKAKVATPSKGKKKTSEAKPKTNDSKTKKNESVVVSMTDVLKDSAASESKSGTTSTDLKTPSPKTKESKTSSPAESAAKDDLKATTPPIPKPAASKVLSKESASSDEEEEEEQFKLKSPPTASEKASSTGPILQTFRKTTKIPSPIPSSPSTKGTTSASKSSSSSGSTSAAATTSGTKTAAASGSSSGKSSKKISATKSASSTSIGSTTTTTSTSGTSTSGTSTSGTGNSSTSGTGNSSTSGTSTTTSGTTSGKTLSTNASPTTAISFQKDVSSYLPINASESATSKSGTSNGSSSGTSLSSSTTSTNAETSETSSGSSSGSTTPSTAKSGNFQQSVYLCPK